MQDNEPTPYLNSRFYRAPEIILGYKHSTALDMWAVGCSVYEVRAAVSRRLGGVPGGEHPPPLPPVQLFTGVPLFHGEKNNDMLWLQQSLLGRLPNRMTRTHLRQCAALGIEAHFDAELRFLHAVRDPVSHAKVRRRRCVGPPPPTPRLCPPPSQVVREVTFTGPTQSLAERLNAKQAADDDPRSEWGGLSRL